MKVQDCSSGQQVCVWKLSKGMNGSEQATFNSPLTPETSDTAALHLPSPIKTVSLEVDKSISQAGENKSLDLDDKESELSTSRSNGLLPNSSNERFRNAPPPYIRLAPSSPSISPSGENLLESQRAANSTSPHPSVTPVSSTSSSSYSNTSMSIPPHPYRPMDSCSNQSCNDVSLSITPVSAHGNDDEDRVDGQAKMPRSLSISNGVNSPSPLAGRQSRINSMLPSATQISNTAALGDIASPGGPENPNVFRYRYAGAGKKGRKRIVQKNGECNVTVANVAKRRRRYLQDIFTTLVDIKWRWTLMVFAMSFILSWLVFAVVWWVIAFTHGDLVAEHLPHNQEINGWTPCVMNIVSFTSCFLFSIETQHTIGYGSRHTTEECPHAIVVMCLQSITGVVIQAFMVGIVFAKLSRPKKRTQTLIFSRKMCILQRDGQMCLMFRVGDIRKSHIIEAHVRAQLIRKHVTQEGEEIPLHMYDLDVGYDVGEDRIFFIWPMTIVHKIDEGSPLYDLSASALQTADFEIVVLLEGVIESTGMTTQARSSYLPDEILWGHRFQPLVSYKKTPREGFFVDLSLFNNTQPVSTPSCSARELDEERSESASTAGADGAPENHGDQKDMDGLSEHSSQGGRG